MRKLAKLAFAGLAATAIAGAAAAASPERHVMDVALPDGGTAHIEYYGKIAPKVTVAPPAFAGFPGMFARGAFPDFGAIMERMNREQAAMMKQVQQMQNRPLVPGGTLNVASYGNMPAGSNIVTVTSVSNNGVTCTRTTQVSSQGVGKPPKVMSSFSGDCAASPPAPVKPSA